MAAVSSLNSPLSLSRKPVLERPTRRSHPLPEGYTLVPLLEPEQLHHDQEQVSPISSHERMNSSDIDEANTTDVSCSSTEPRDTPGQRVNDQNKLASTAPSGIRKRSKSSNHSWRHYIRKFWFWEFSACLLSFACFSSMAAVLWYEYDKPLDTWELFISRPATISFIGTLAKASLVLVLSSILSQMKWLHFQDARSLDHLKVFDSASRGPLGSVMVLLKSRKVLASVAACLMILTILLDPFVQLVFTFPTRLLVDPRQYVFFNQARPLQTLGSLHSGPSAKMWFAFNEGFTDTNTTTEINCPTGNCSWSQPVNTLGVCGSCSQANVSKTCLPTAVYANDIGWNINITTCFYTFNDIVLSTKHDGDKPLAVAVNSYWSEGESTYGRWGILWNATSYMSSTRVDRSPPFPSNETFNATIDVWQYLAPQPGTLYYNGTGGILEFAAVQILPTSDELSPDFLDPPARCWACKLNWCEKSFEKLHVVNNQFTSTVLERPLWNFHRSPEFSEYTTYGVSPEDVHHQFNTTSTWAKYTYFDNDFLWLLDVFNSYYVDEIQENVFPSFNGTNLVHNTGMLASMVDATDLNITMSRIAERFSELIRTNIGSEYIYGDVQVSKSIIEIRWEWLVLPITVLIITSILLMIVARKSYKSEVSTWKDDPTALLLHRITGLETDSDDKSIIRLEDLTKLRKETYVKLSSDEALTFAKVAGKVKQK